MGLTSFEGFGLAPNFRRAAQAGTIDVQEYSEHTLICALQAATAGVPFMPTRAGLGTDMPALHPDRTWEMVDERSGQRFLACAALAPEVAVIHVHEADADGNARMNPKLVWFDTELVKAAKRVIVTAERIIDNAEFRAAPRAHLDPRLRRRLRDRSSPWRLADRVLAQYPYDWQFYLDYQRAARDPEAFAALLRRACRWAGLPDAAAR